MQFLTSLFGGSEGSILTAILALVAVIALILIVLYVMKLMFRGTAAVNRVGKRRLAVIDQLALDPKRRLVIVRRDNVDHLLLIGGPQDVVVEGAIPVETQAVRGPQGRRGPPQAQGRAEPGLGELPPPPAAAVAAPPPAPIAQPAKAEPRPGSPLDRLRDLGRGVAPRRAPSLRHTGLMRPVSRMETPINPANPHNADHGGADSATTGPRDDAKGPAGAAQSQQRDDQR